MRYVILTSLALVLPFVLAPAEPPRYWSQAIVVDRASSDAAREVDLVHVEQRDILIGGLEVINRSTLSAAPQKVPVIDGHQAADGTFWPSVELQVQREKGGEWTKIGTSGHDNPARQLQLYSSTTVNGLRVNLDPFKSYLGKFLFGRILLKSGDAAIFKLDDLKPPREEN